MHNIYYQLQLSNTSDNSKEIVFIGDSFTWGQGLYLDYWKENRPELFEKFYANTIENETHLQWIDQQEFIGKEEMIIKDNLSFTNKVGESLGRKVYKKKYNGGSITSNRQLLENFYKLESEKRDVILIFQFTSLGREDFGIITDEEFSRYNLLIHRPDSVVREILKDRIYSIYKSIDSIIDNLETELGWRCYYLDWLGDFSEFDEKNRFIKINDNTSFFNLVLNNPIKIEYKDKIFYDYHLNRKGNIILAESILKKINLENS
jgi:hypothetical protein